MPSLSSCALHRAKRSFGVFTIRSNVLDCLRLTITLNHLRRNKTLLLPWPYTHSGLTFTNATTTTDKKRSLSPFLSARSSAIATTTPSTISIDTEKVQPFDFTAMTACVTELARDWIPSRVEEVVQYNSFALAVRLRTMERSLWLYISWNPTLAHVGISELGPPRGSAASEFSFGDQMRGALRGMILTRVYIPQPWERTMAMEFSARPGDDDRTNNVTVHVEIVGRYSNVVLTRGETVVAAGHQVGVKKSSARAVYVGKPYLMPPPPHGIAPSSINTFEEWHRILLQDSVLHANVDTLQKRFIGRFQGVSPSLAREMCDQSGIRPDADPNEVGDSQWKALYAQWTRWVKDMTQGNALNTGYWCPKSNTYSFLQATANQMRDEFSSPLMLLRHYYGWFEQGSEFKAAKQRIMKGINTAIARLQKKIISLEKQAADPSAHKNSSHMADLLMAHLHLIKPNMTAIEVEDWDMPGTVVTLHLDPEKTAIECAEELYKKARKQRRAVDQVAPLLEETRLQLDYLQDTEVLMDQLDGEDAHGDLTALRETEAELVAGGFMKASSDAALAEKASKKASKKGGTSKKSKNSDNDEDGYRRYASPNGFTVLVGRNSRQNDQLTMKVAQPTDVWMHARGVPGAHVLLRVPAGQNAGDVDLQFAANLAAYFSKYRNEGKADVTVANPSHISKPRGAKLGQVLVKQEKVIVGRPSQSVASEKNED